MDEDGARKMAMKMVAPAVETFKLEIAAMRERGESEEKIAAMLDYIESNNTFTDDNMRKLLMDTLREAARPPHKGPGTVQ